MFLLNEISVLAAHMCEHATRLYSHCAEQCKTLKLWDSSFRGWNICSIFGHRCHTWVWLSLCGQQDVAPITWSQPELCLKFSWRNWYSNFSCKIKLNKAAHCCLVEATKHRWNIHLSAFHPGLLYNRQIKKSVLSVCVSNGRHSLFPCRK